MNFYKIRHKPTGMFFKPSVYPSKTNLSKKGKTYQTMPSSKWIDCFEDFNRHDWEIVKYEVIEKAVLKF